jgi:hypothetical protein
MKQRTVNHIYSLMAVLILTLLSQSGYSQSREFVIHDTSTTATIICDTTDYATVKLAARLLAEDIERITGHKPAIQNDLKGIKGNVIIIGSIDSSRLIRNPAIKKYINIAAIQGKWETYLVQTVKRPLPGITNALIISGSDSRGTAYGVFNISERIGISPWYWWADVKPKQQSKLSLPFISIVSNPPSVKYRGIFLNDEDWGLQPWAAKTFEPETGDIGPKTYARIFELLLRLKANLIWPAMHPCTKAFYHYPKNREVADEYSIVIGSSHAEPMLRNNVDEWNESKMGEYNYFVNREAIYNYWKQRADESKRYENIYTLGMRGIHDSGMEGSADVSEQITVLEKIFSDQREIIRTSIASDVTRIPQAFIPYKEVLSVYDKGLKLPEDITIVWPDDNYGYIQRLSNDAEQKRSGGAGIYYHLSYWGRPHDYLWLSSTHPMLIWEEMMKAYTTKNDRMWIVNVGDIKPIEYSMNLFLDMAYDIKPFSSPDFVKVHLEKWMHNIFGNASAPVLADVTWQYYQLAFERRPEFMGWSQTEPTTATHVTAYNHFSHNDEATKRLDHYTRLYKQVTTIKNKIDRERRDAFYELVYYPVRCAQLMNRKFLLNEKANYYAQQHRASANDFAEAAGLACDSIALETDYYNNKLANGKWKHMMSKQPRDLPVFECPMTASWKMSGGGWGICVEGNAGEQPQPDYYGNRLPIFYTWNSNIYFVDVFLTGKESVIWQAIPSQPWIRLSKSAGTLTSLIGEKEERVWVTINHALLPKEKSAKGSIVFKAGTKEFSIPVQVYMNAPAGFNGFIEENDYISMFAVNYSSAVNTPELKWKSVDGLGYAGKVVMLAPAQESYSDKPTTTQASLKYDFYTFSKGNAQIKIYCLPTHALNTNHQMRLAISVDGQEPQVIDYRTFDRSETWKQNVLCNSASSTITHSFKEPGNHTLAITALDPGIIVDRITIDFGGLKSGYSAVPETKIMDGNEK